MNIRIGRPAIIASLDIQMSGTYVRDVFVTGWSDRPHARPYGPGLPMKSPRKTGILLLTCSDQRGLVAAVSDFVVRHGGNIVHADQHTDEHPYFDTNRHAY